MVRWSAKSRLRERDFIAGPFVETRSPEIVEALGVAGFDFCVIDREHSALSGDATGDLIRAAAAAGLAPLVRVRDNSPGEMLEALDLGAVGLHVPRVASAADARRAVAAAKFPPAGERGFNPFVRAAEYGGLSVEEFRRTADDDTLLALHIEAQGSLAAVSEILDVPGIDVAFLGPYDLSQALGVPGEVAHPKVREALRTVAAAARPRGIAVGCFAKDPEQARMWIEAGASYLAYSVDAYLFLDAARSARRALDEIVGRKGR